jgi:hypothetical protein
LSIRPSGSIFSCLGFFLTRKYRRSARFISRPATSRNTRSIGVVLGFCIKPLQYFSEFSGLDMTSINRCFTVRVELIPGKSACRSYAPTIRHQLPRMPSEGRNDVDISTPCPAALDNARPACEYTLRRVRFEGDRRTKTAVHPDNGLAGGGG